MKEELTPKQRPVKEISALYKIPEWTIRGYITKGIIPYRKIGRRIYIPIDRFEAWLTKYDNGDK